MYFKKVKGGILLSTVFLGFFTYMVVGTTDIFDNILKNKNQKIFSADISASMPNKEEPTKNVSPEVNAKSAISVESNLQYINKTIFKKNTDTVLPIASLTKLMTAIIVLDNYNLSDIVTVDDKADSQDLVNQDVKLGDKMPAESFLEIMLIESSNKSAYALSELIGEQKFVDLMNKKAKDIGLKNTFFADPTGLSPKDVSTTADLEKLAEYIIKNYPRILEITKQKELDVFGFGKIQNTDQLLGEVPDIVCSKTGYTPQANGCLLLVINNPKNNDYIINIILGADDRFLEMKKLINLSDATCR